MSKKYLPHHIEQICIRLETGKARAWQIANELDTHPSNVYNWYRRHRGMPLTLATGRTRGKDVRHRKHGPTRGYGEFAKCVQGDKWVGSKEMLQKYLAWCDSRRANTY